MAKKLSCSKLFAKGLIEQSKNKTIIIVSLLGLLAKIVQVNLGGHLTPTIEDLPEPSHDRVFCEMFHSVYVVKGIWSLLTDLLWNRIIIVMVG